MSEEKLRVLLVMLFMTVAITSSGCRSSDVGLNASVPSMPPRDGVDQAAYPTAANIRQYKVAEAAQNIPRAGSVTQSSDADGSHVTLDSFNVDVSAIDGQLSYVVSYSGDELLSTKTGTEATGVAAVLDRPEGTHLYERVEGGVEFYRSLEEVDVEFGKHGATQTSLNVKPGDIWVDVYTDFQAEGSTDADADYLARGIWVYVPDDATNLHDYEYGAFADGNDPFVQDNLAGLTGTATYTGEDRATGLYANATEQQNEFFEADVTLTANFGHGGELGSIEGRIHDIETDGATLPGNPRLMLGSANIGASHSGFFDGDTSMAFEGKSFTGKWGGQFFSNGASSAETPGSVAGTFGAATENGRESFLGSFNAYRPTTPPPITVDYTKPSHDLQASVARTNWTAFRNGPGTSIAYGDFDGDGDEDVFFSPSTLAQRSVCSPDAYCFARANPVEIWENVDNNFVLNTQKFFSGNVPEVFNPRKALIGDFNGDGKPDIFLATHGPAAPPFPREEPPFLFLSTENGLIQTEGLEDFRGFNHGAASADIDQDDDLDIIVMDAFNGPYFLINDGNGNFERNTTVIPSRLYVDTAELVDVDSDGFPDLLLGGHSFRSNAASTAISSTAIYWGNSSGEYSDSNRTILPDANGTVVDIDVGDLDGDGNKDIVVNRTATERYTGQYIQVISGLGNRTFSDATSQNIAYAADATGRWIIWLRLMDVNGDGHLDIFVDGNPNKFGWTWLNDGAGHMRLSDRRYTPFVLHPAFVVPRGLNDGQIRQSMHEVVGASNRFIQASIADSSSRQPEYGVVSNPVVSGPTVDSVDQGMSFESLQNGLDVNYSGSARHDLDVVFGYNSADSFSHLGFGGWMEHHAYFLNMREIKHGGIATLDADVYSIGKTTRTNPVSGGAVWKGVAIGANASAVGRRRVIMGNSEITVDFSEFQVDVRLSNLEDLETRVWCCRDITWDDLPLSNGGFGMSETGNSIQGQFYGPGHEEVGGVFVRGQLVGAFGGQRE